MIGVAKKSSENGLALIMVMLIVMLMLSISSVSALRSRTIASDEILERAQIRAFQAAEGGLAKARHLLAKDPLYRGERFKLGNATVEIRLQPIAGSAEEFEAQIRASVPGFGELAAPITCRTRSRLLRGSGLPRVSSWRVLR